MPQATFSIIASLKFLRIAYDFLRLLRQSYKTRTLPKTPHPPPIPYPLLLQLRHPLLQRCILQL